jgi:hypothetical protein
VRELHTNKFQNPTEKKLFTVLKCGEILSEKNSLQNLANSFSTENFFRKKTLFQNLAIIVLLKILLKNWYFFG